MHMRVYVFKHMHAFMHVYVLPRLFLKVLYKTYK